VAQVDARVVLLAGTVLASLGGALTKLSETSSATATFFRCALALPVLGVLAAREYRRLGMLSRRTALFHALGGIMLGIDMVLWASSIPKIGAGMASVIVSVQIVVAPVLARVIRRTPIPRVFVSAAPFLLCGIALAGGVIGSPEVGGDLMVGTALALTSGVAYGVYVFIAGAVGSDDRAGSQVFLTTLFAGLVGLVVGGVGGTLDLTPGWVAFGWLVLLSLTTQVVGWFLIGRALPMLSASVGSTILTVMPVSAVAAAMLIVGERPSLLQLVGCGMVVAAVGVVSRRRPGRTAQPAQMSPTVNPVGNGSVGSRT